MYQEKPKETIIIDPDKPYYVSTLTELAALLRIYQTQLERQRRIKLL